MVRAIVAAAGAVMAVSGIAVEAATSQAAYPSKPIRFIVPFAPGGPSDILSRLVGQKLGESLGQTVVVDNRASVGGIVGGQLAAQSQPDGHTLLIAPNSLITIGPHVYSKLPFDPQRDLRAVTQLTSGGGVVAVHPSVAAKSVGELIALAKANPGKINYATSGTGNLLAVANFKSMANIDMVPIAYKGTGQAVIDLLAGHVQLFFMNPLVAVPHVKSGKLRALAVTSLTRNTALPDVPTVTESGLPGYKNISWHGLFVPVRTPASIVTRLNAELIKIVHSTDVQERFASQGLTGVGSKSEEIAALIKEESAEYAAVVKKIGYKPQ